MSKKCKSLKTSILKKGELLMHVIEVRKFIAKNTDDKNLLSYMEDIETALSEKKYGLFFEEHSEEIERILEKNGIELVEQKELAIKQGNRESFLIEGENLAVLSYLTKTYLAKVDVVYVDSPYNTGMESLNYDDSIYADPKDTYRHSKWLSFMNKRLRAAYNLLSKNGVMFIHIDEHETGTLLLLCQNIFGEANVVALVWPKTDPRFDQNRVERPFHNIKIVHENIFVCFKDKQKTNFNPVMIHSQVSMKRTKRPPATWKRY